MFLLFKDLFYICNTFISVILFLLLRGEAGLEREKMGIFYEFFVTQQKDQPKICEIGFII